MCCLWNSRRFRPRHRSARSNSTIEPARPYATDLADAHVWGRSKFERQFNSINGSYIHTRSGRQRLSALAHPLHALPLDLPKKGLLLNHRRGAEEATAVHCPHWKRPSNQGARTDRLDDSGGEDLKRTQKGYRAGNLDGRVGTSELGSLRQFSWAEYSEVAKNPEGRRKYEVWQQLAATRPKLSMFP